MEAGFGRGRRAALCAAIGLCLSLAGATAWWLLSAPCCAGPGPDPNSPDQLAAQYRALGPNLLGGVLRCAGLPVGPGQLDRAACDGGGWSLELVAHDGTEALHAARGSALTPAPDSARAAAVDDGVVAFGLDQTPDGRTRIHWDAATPRPVSATLTSDRLPLPELLAVYDARGFAALERPDPPGPAFSSPVLWRFAAPLVTGGGDPACAPRPSAERADDLLEQVDCRFPNGVRAAFGLWRRDADLRAFRRDISPAEAFVAGTHRIATWRPDGQVIDYILLGETTRHLYYDDASTLTEGMLKTDVLSPEELHRFWAEHNR